MPVLDDTQRSDIQGNILRAYGFRFGRYSILRVRDVAGARRLLTRLLDENLIISATAWDKDAKPDAAINVALTHAGLAAMGVPAEKLETFPPEFIAGMAARAAELGDSGRNAPENWEFGRDPESMHVLISVYGRDAKTKEAMLRRLNDELDAVGKALEVTHRLDVSMLPEAREHFGFADGIGQPDIEGSGAPSFPGDGTPADGGRWTPLKAGEFVLGYEGEGPPLAMPAAPFGHNGSFLAYRKLKQHVADFRKFLRSEAARIYGENTPETAPEDEAKLAAKLVGRWRSGCPISRSPQRDDPELARDWQRNNDFRFGDDARGAVCPVGSHIRRMNPRDAKIDGLVRTHRIVRRGLTYGPLLEGDADDGVDRGVAFMAINASLLHQFEVLQQLWANSGEFADLDREEVDPFVGARTERSQFRTMGGDGVMKRLNLPPFVTLCGGGYFFIPSLTALRALANGNA